MQELKTLINIHEVAFNMATKESGTGNPNTGLWDIEQELSDRMEEVASNIGALLVGHVNPKIELIVLG
jgi:hypothetical protein|tara:strand:+ start:65 stop:268 length:204 start_codon:yes stop_codon:yes gene_type:complete